MKKIILKGNKTMKYIKQKHKNTWTSSFSLFEYSNYFALIHLQNVEKQYN